MERSAVELLPEELDTGVYYGYGCVDYGAVHEMVMSIGTNPYYNNKERSMVRCCVVQCYRQECFLELVEACVDVHDVRFDFRLLYRLL